MTISRYRKVAFLECDPGQSEFTPAGMVALNIIEQPVFGAWALQRIDRYRAS